MGLKEQTAKTIHDSKLLRPKYYRCFGRRASQ